MSEFLPEDDLGGGVRVLRLARPPASALNSPFLLEIEDRLNTLAGDPDLKALILTGTGKVLSAGLDLKEAVGFSDQDQTDIVDALNRAYAALYGFPKPVVAAINGHAIAGGFFFVLGADYRIAATESTFGLTEVRVGVTFPVVALEMAKAELSATMSRRFLLSGLNIKADEARDHKVIDEIVGRDTVLSRAVEVARDYAKIPPIAYADVKRQLRSEVLIKARAAIDGREDPALQGWFTEETRSTAAALLKAATGKSRTG